jgi:hypothetical protein
MGDLAFLGPDVDHFADLAFLRPNVDHRPWSTFILVDLTSKGL